MKVMREVTWAADLLYSTSIVTAYLLCTATLCYMFMGGYKIIPFTHQYNKAIELHDL